MSGGPQVVEGKLVILAAGVSSRMKKPAPVQIDSAIVTDADKKVKAMIGVGEGQRPFLDYLLYNARAAGYRDVVLVVGEENEPFRQYYGRQDSGNLFYGLTISYAVQLIPAGRTKPPGTADALVRCLEVRQDWKGKQFTVCNSDNLYSSRGLKLLLDCLAECSMIDYDRRALGLEWERVEQFAVVSKSADGRLLDIIEKPTPDIVAGVKDETGRVGVSMNIFRFRYELIEPFLRSVPFHPVRQEKELPTAVAMMLREFPGSLVAIPLSERVPDLTGRSDIAAVQKFLVQEHPNFSWL
jgi:glucose-1-phosphate adenylyltransferase